MASTKEEDERKLDEKKSQDDMGALKIPFEDESDDLLSNLPKLEPIRKQEVNNTKKQKETEVSSGSNESMTSSVDVSRLTKPKVSFEIHPYLNHCLNIFASGFQVSKSKVLEMILDAFFADYISSEKDPDWAMLHLDWDADFLDETRIRKEDFSELENLTQAGIVDEIFEYCWRRYDHNVEEMHKQMEAEEEERRRAEEEPYNPHYDG